MLPLAMNRQANQQLPRTNETDRWRSHSTGQYQFRSLMAPPSTRNEAGSYSIATNETKESNKRPPSGARIRPVASQLRRKNPKLTKTKPIATTPHATLDRWRESKQHQRLQQGSLAQRAYLGKARITKRPAQAHRGGARRFSRTPAAQPQKRHIVASSRNLAPPVCKRPQTKLDHTSP